MKQLAIVIPAYKDTFLRQALLSIEAQTCHDFTLYIGDDCSPHNIAEIVDEFKDKIDIVYKRFDTNIGGKDLVAQWNRCITMTNNEPYIWLFSDDDVMESKCVEEFFMLDKDDRDNFLIHFDIGIIDEFQNGIQSLQRPYPPFLSAKDYLDEKLQLNGKEGLYSFVIEFIFSRNIFCETGGIENFDLAWGADFITWLKFAGKCRGIKTIKAQNTHVLWRKSNQNISPNTSKPILLRKLYATIDYTSYIKRWLEQNEYKYTFKYSKFVWGEIKRNRKHLNSQDIDSIEKAYNAKIGVSLLSKALYFVSKLYK